MLRYFEVVAGCIDPETRCRMEQREWEVPFWFTRGVNAAPHLHGAFDAGCTRSCSCCILCQFLEYIAKTYMMNVYTNIMGKTIFMIGLVGFDGKQDAFNVSWPIDTHKPRGGHGFLAHFYNGFSFLSNLH